MTYQSSTEMASRRSRKWTIAERLDLHTALVSLGAGALGAAILAIVSSGLVYTNGTLAVHNQDALVMALVIGVIEAILTALFKTGAFEMDHDDPTPLPLYMENIRLSTRRSPVVHAHFRSWETEQLKQIARDRAIK